MKKVLALFIIFMFVFTGNLIAAPITVNTMDTLTKSAVNTGHPEGWLPDMPLADETAVPGNEGREVSVLFGAEQSLEQNGGALRGGLLITDSEFPAPHKPVAPVPEPASLVLLGVGMLSAGFFARKKRRNS